MTNATSMNILGRLFYLQSCSLPRYVVHASPYIAPGDEHLFDCLQAVAAGQERMASHIADALLSRHGRLPRASFPMRFTCLHDLELRRLLALALKEQRSVVNEIEAAITALAGDVESQRLAREMRRIETAHLTLLEELSSNHRIRRSSRSSPGDTKDMLGAPQRITIEKSPLVTAAA